MRRKRLADGRSNFLSYLSPQGRSQTSSTPLTLDRNWANLICPICGGSNAPPYKAIFLMFIKDIKVDDHCVSYFFSVCACFCLFACSFLISFNLWRYF